MTQSPDKQPTSLEGTKRISSPMSMSALVFRPYSGLTHESPTAKPKGSSKSACCFGWCFARRKRPLSRSKSCSDTTNDNHVQEDYGHINREPSLQSSTGTCSISKLDDLRLTPFVPPTISVGDPSGVSVAAKSRPNEDSYRTGAVTLPDGSVLTILSVFDGHGNCDLAKWLALHILSIVESVLSLTVTQSSVALAIKSIRPLFPSEASYKTRIKVLSRLKCPDTLTFGLCAALAVAEEVALTLKEVDTATGGACATLAAIRQSTGAIHIALCGDSAAAVVDAGSGVVLFKTVDHRVTTRPDEIRRIESEGGRVHKQRAIGLAACRLSVTRALGDTIWKSEMWSRDESRDSITGRQSVDASLVAFSKSHGCTGLSSIPEWYVVDMSGRRNVRTNAPMDHSEINAIPYAIHNASSMFRAFLVVGSDGLWEGVDISCACRDATGSVTLAHDLISHIGESPSDDSTGAVCDVVVKLRKGYSGSTGDTPFTPSRPAATSFHLDALFEPPKT